MLLKTLHIFRTYNDSLHGTFTLVSETQEIEIKLNEDQASEIACALLSLLHNYAGIAANDLRTPVSLTKALSHD